MTQLAIPQFGPQYDEQKMRRLAEEIERLAKSFTTRSSVEGAVAWADITGIPPFAVRWPSWAEVTDKPTTFPPASHTHTFLSLTDSPATFSGQGGRLVRVNGAENSLEFADPEAAASIPWTNITSKPDNITALAAMTGTGIMVRQPGGTYVNRSIAVSTRLAITEPSGFNANPTLDLATVTQVDGGLIMAITLDAYGRVVESEEVPIYVDPVDGGIIIGDAVGGSMGPGTVNAEGLFIDGDPVGSGSGGGPQTISRGATWIATSGPVTTPVNDVYSMRVPFDGEIQNITVGTLGGTGSCVIDVRVTPYASFPPGGGDSITASAKPTISGGIKYFDDVLTGWGVSVLEGDVISFHLESSSTFTAIFVSMEILQLDPP